MPAEGAARPRVAEGEAQPVWATTPAKGPFKPGREAFPARCSRPGWRFCEPRRPPSRPILRLRLMVLGPNPLDHFGG